MLLKVLEKPQRNLNLGLCADGWGPVPCAAAKFFLHNFFLSLIFPLSWSLQRSAWPLGCCVCSLLTAACRTSQTTSPLAAGCDVQYTVMTVMWKNTPGRWYGLMLMATSSSPLMRSCSQIVRCPMFHHLLLRNTASLSAFLSPLYFVVSIGSHLTWWSRQIYHC